MIVAIWRHTNEYTQSQLFGDYLEDCLWSQLIFIVFQNMIKLPFLGLDEIKEDPKAFGKALFAEFLGTALLVRSKKKNSM